MKNLIKISTVVGLVVLCGCSSTGGSAKLDEVIDSVNNESGNVVISDTPSEITGDIIVAEDGVGLGVMGDIMQTDFLDFTVNSAYETDTFDTITASEGYKLLVVEISVTNTNTSTITMIDTDFMVMWDIDDAQDDDIYYAWPLCEFTGEEGEESDYTKYAVLSSQQLPAYYDLDSNATATGNLVYEVDDDASEYYIAFEEYYSDGTTGDIYAVGFTLE